mgnify:FL=1
MSTTTLSQRLRDLRNGLFPDIETVNAVLDKAIAQAEAQEGQAGELSDEEIKRILNANTYEDLNDSRQGGYVTSSDHDAYDMGMIAGLKYARDHYLKPSQAIEALEVMGRAFSNYESGVPISVDELRRLNSQALSALRA